MAAAKNLSTNPDTLRESIRVVSNMPDGVEVVTLSLEGDIFKFVRDGEGNWYLAEVE